VSALRKAECHFSLQASFKDACVNLKAQQVSNMHHIKLPYSSLGTYSSTATKHIEPPSNKMESINSKLKSNPDKGGGVEC
jgi:hypothetical protein